MAYNSETGLYEGYIYKITNEVNDKIYIGQTTRTIKQRFMQHISCAERNVDLSKIHSEMYKIGTKKFKVSCVDKVVGENYKKIKTKLDELEKYYIKKFNTKDPNGYNQQGGGQGITPKIIKLFSFDGELLNTFYSNGEASQVTGISSSHISANCHGTNLGTKVGVFRFENDDFNKYKVTYKEDTSKKIYKYNIYGEKIKEYKSITKFSEEYGVTKTSGCRYLKMHTLVDFDFVLFSCDEKFDLNKITLPSCKPIDKFTRDGEFIKTYRNATLAAEDSDTDPSSVIKCCRYKANYIKQYIFRYSEKYTNILKLLGDNNEKEEITYD